MRIGIATWTSRLAGGVETYLGALVPALLDRKHQVALLHEVDDPADRAAIAPNAPHWCVASDGLEECVAALSRWKPDVVFAQGCDDPALDARVAEIAPTVFFAHAYRGTCISGTKTLAARRHSACDRRLGWGCLAHYFPDRCGGLNPTTMVTLFRREVQRRDLLPKHAAVVMFSEHIRREYIRHGVEPDRAHRLPCHAPSTAIASAARVEPEGGLPSRILFAGRMESLKGGHILLESLPAVQRTIGRALQVRFLGDGRQRERWEAHAERLTAANGAVEVQFTGWVDADERTRLLLRTDLLVLPSLWPEPFGLIGLEAAACGVPAAAFETGGISEWLRHGVNGYLAPAVEPRAGHLAQAIVACLRERSTHDSLSRGAVEMSAQHSMRAHVTALLGVFAGAVSPVTHVHTDPAA